jgi:hypothetical protein
MSPQPFKKNIIKNISAFRLSKIKVNKPECALFSSHPLQLTGTDWERKRPLGHVLPLEGPWHSTP